LPIRPRRGIVALIMASALDVGGSLFGSEYEDITCRVRITGVDDAAVRVAGFQVDEGLSQLFSFELEVATDPREVANLEKVLGADATVILERERVRSRSALRDQEGRLRATPVT